MKSNITFNILINNILILGLTFIMCSFVDVKAATITVKVKSGSSPLSEASVCLGDSGNNSKYGYKKTNNQGKAVFEEITATQVKATVSKTGYSGAQSTFSAGTDVFVPFNLTTGDQGPVCGKTSRLTPVNKPIKKSSVVHSKDKKSTTITL